MDEVYEIQHKQGWTDDTLRILMRRFIEESGRMDALVDFRQRVADEENEECSR